MPPPHVEEYREQGFAVVRGVFSPAEMREIAAAADRVYAAGMRHHASWRHGNIYFEVIEDPAAGRVVRHAQWPSRLETALERCRRDPRLLALLEPLIGDSLKQLTNQIHWKPPGARIVGFRYHQDARFRRPAEAFRKLTESFVQTGLAIDPHGADNGAVRLFPGSHRLGYLDLSRDGPIMKGYAEDETLAEAGLDPARVVEALLEPGDVLLWHPHTVHGSGANVSRMDRRFYINGYVTAANADRGEWAFRGGRPCPLGPEQALIHYDGLYERPDPHYVETTWYRD